MGGVGQRAHVLEAAEVVRVLDHEAGDLVREQVLGLVGARHAAVVPGLGKLGAGACQHRSEDGAIARVQAPGHDDLLPPRRAYGRADGFGERRRRIREGRKSRLEPSQLREEGL